MDMTRMNVLEFEFLQSSIEEIINKQKFVIFGTSKLTGMSDQICPFSGCCYSYS